MSIEFVFRLFIALASAATAAFALVRVTFRRGADQAAIGALGAYSGAIAIIEASILNTDVTVRTFGLFLASLVGLLYVAALIREKRPPK